MSELKYCVNLVSILNKFTSMMSRQVSIPNEPVNILCEKLIHILNTLVSTLYELVKILNKFLAY